MASMEMEVTDGSWGVWKTPLKKLARFFERSRDRWKAKYVAKREQYKRMGNQVRAVEKSRVKWRQTAEHAQKQIRELESELEQYKKKFPA